MMAWPEEPRNGNGEWPDAELLESANFYPPDGGDERAQHGANNFLNASQNQAGPAGLTYSASCPSFSGLDNADDIMAGAGGDGLMPFPYRTQEPLMDALGPVGDSPFPEDKNYDMLLQFQQEYQNPSQRQFPHQQMMGQSMDLIQQQMPTGRRGFHGSLNFSNLSTMESEYSRMNANSKRKKGTERWMKLQRHKSFDSCTPIPDSFNLNPRSPDSDMIGFGIDDFSSSMPSNDPNWPQVAYGSAPSSIGINYMEQAHQKRQHQQQAPSDGGDDLTVSSSVDVEPVSELDMLLSENERANLFDAIRDFESPGEMDSIDA
ncbi:Hypothetical protein PHPALM_5225 [Phytophthora palmivora]|uniref:Uncharacterized protein n=1 Tax=Phytophthora palmivora TaxID=4796 RepID=A0A2P4YHX0_9STRA|nr:Hypothetical protein PHPALM_5225 [Phytophthora palmivora]